MIPIDQAINLPMPFGHSVGAALRGLGERWINI